MVPLTQLVRASDWFSKDPGLNPKYQCLFFLSHCSIFTIESCFEIYCKLKTTTSSFCVDCSFFLRFLSTAIEIGFTRQRITRLEHFASQFDEIVNKSRVSEQTFELQFEISTIITSSGLQRATQDEDFAIPGSTVVYNTLSPSESNLQFGYIIFYDDRPENTEVFQVSVTPDPRDASNPSFDCNKDNGCYWQIEIRIEDDDGELSFYLGQEFLICHLNYLCLLPKFCS